MYLLCEIVVVWIISMSLPVKSAGDSSGKSLEKFLSKLRTWMWKKTVNVTMGCELK